MPNFYMQGITVIYNLDIRIKDLFFSDKEIHQKVIFYRFLFEVKIVSYD